MQHGSPLARIRVLQKTTSQPGDTSQAFPSMRSPSSVLVLPLNRLIYPQILTRCLLEHAQFMANLGIKHAWNGSKYSGGLPIFLASIVGYNLPL
ncbi:hypothetical protein TNCV_1716541 [Trichonephila clavipes]|nr:hypothetical protein TNCV_1716541 [Trichonephila clavipes]